MPLVERLSGNKRKIKNGTLLHIWLRSRDTFTHLGKATGTLYTSGRSNQDTFTHLGRHKTIVLGRFYTTNGNTLYKSQAKTLC